MASVSDDTKITITYERMQDIRGSVATEVSLQAVRYTD